MGMGGAAHSVSDVARPILTCGTEAAGYFPAGGAGGSLGGGGIGVGGTAVVLELDELPQRLVLIATDPALLQVLLQPGPMLPHCAARDLQVDPFVQEVEALGARDLRILGVSDLLEQSFEHDGVHRSSFTASASQFARTVRASPARQGRATPGAPSTFAAHRGAACRARSGSSPSAVPARPGAPRRTRSPSGPVAGAS